MGMGLIKTSSCFIIAVRQNTILKLSISFFFTKFSSMKHNLTSHQLLHFVQQESESGTTILPESHTTTSVRDNMDLLSKSNTSPTAKVMLTGSSVPSLGMSKSSR